MQIIAKLTQTRRIMLNSPVRVNLGENRKLLCNVTNDDISEFGTLVRDMDVLIAESLNPLNIVLMGEIKSGKSTLLNAIVGDKIAPVDVLEATSAVLNFRYGEEQKGIINFKDGSKQESSIEDIYEILKNKQTDETFYSRVKIVNVEKPLDKFRHYNLIDTPGVTTMTPHNVSLTNEYIQHADVIVWVLNSNYLDQKDVNEKMMEIYSYGKPMICVVTHVDVENKDTGRLMASIESKEYSSFFSGILAVSGKFAYESSVSGDEKGKSASGLNDVLKSLDRVGKSKELSIKTKEQSLNSSFVSIVKKDLRLHSIMDYDISVMGKEFERFLKEITYYRETLNRKTEDRITSYVRKEFLEKEARLIADRIKKIKKIDNEVFAEEASQVITAACLKGYAENIKEDVEVFLKSEWADILKIISQNIAQDMKDYYQRRSEMFGRDSSEFSINRKLSTDLSLAHNDFNFSEELVKSLCVAGGAGAGIAAWAALFSTYAAYIAFVPAFVSLLPIIVLGGVGGVFGKMFFTRQKNRDKEIIEAVRKAVDEMKEELSEKYISKEVLPEIYKRNKEIEEKVTENFVNRVFGNWKQTEVSNFKNSLEQYLGEMEDMLRS